MEWIPVAGPWITEREIRYTADAAANGWYANHGFYPDRFETTFAAHLGVAKAVSLPSCTSALHLALAALGIGPRDEVIVPDATWIATSAPISYVGAVPVFADIDAQSWCIDPASLERAITPRTRAVIVVHLYGNMPDMDAIMDVARRHGLAVIEDAAEAIGSEYRGRKAGSIGDVGTFSFHGSKTLTTGEGGMLVTSRPDILARVLRLRDHGREPGDHLFMNLEVGFKYKMSALQAAFGLGQLERIDELIARKREIFGWYAKHLAALPGITLNSEAATTRNAYWMVTAVFDRALGIDKVDMIARLRSRNIDSRPFFHPLSSLPAYRDRGGPAAWQPRNPVSYDVSSRAINLPSGFNMTEPLVVRVAEALQAITATGPSTARARNAAS